MSRLNPVPHTPLRDNPTEDAIWKRYLEQLWIKTAAWVSGPSSSTDNAVARFNGTDGIVLQNSGVIIDDSNNVTGVASITVTGLTSGRVALVGTAGLLTDDAGITYDAAANSLTATTFNGALNGNASTATLASTITVADAAGDTSMFVMLAGAATGSLPVLTDAGISYNANTNTLTVSGVFSAGGNITSTGGDISATRASVGGDVVIAVSNTDNTNTASNAINRITVGGASGGDPMFQWQISGSITWAAGLDNSDSDRWKLSKASALGTNDYIIVDPSAGAITVQALTASSVTNSALTSGRVTFAGASGLLTDSGNLLYNSGTNTFTTVNVTVTTLLTAGSGGITTASGDLGITSATGITSFSRSGSGQIIAYNDGTNSGDLIASDGTNFYTAVNGDKTLRYLTNSVDRININSASNLSVNMGNASTLSPAISKANVNTTAVGNVGTGEDNLITYTLPASAMNVATRGVRIKAWGTVANTAALKTLRFYFGSTVMISNALATLAANVWVMEALVFSTGTDTQDYLASINLATTGATAPFVGTSAQDDGAAIVIKCTGEATNNNDIVQEGMLVEFLN